VILEQAL
jgi:hypothetical protein